MQASFGDSSGGLRDGTSELAVVHPPLDVTALRMLPLYTERRAVWLPADHPLAGRTTTTLAEVLEHPTRWIEPPGDDPVWLAFWTAAAERAARGPRWPTLTVRTPEEYATEVAAGQGVGLVGASITPSSVAPGTVVVPVEDLAPAEAAVAWRADDDRPLLPRLAEILRAEAVAAGLPGGR